MKRIAGLLTAALLMSAAACRQKEAQKKIPITTSSEKARAAYLKARDLMEHQRSADARPLLDEAIREDPKFAMALLLRARSGSSTNEFFQRLKSAVAAAPTATDPEQMLIRADEALSNGDRKGSGEVLAKLVAAWPEDEHARESLGLHLYQGRQYDAAAAEFRKAIQLNPAFAPAYNMLGYALRETGSHKDAEAALRKYVELVPNEPNPLDSLAELMLETGRLEESVSLYQKAATLDPKFTSAYRGAAASLTFLDRHKEAMEQLQKMYDVARSDLERQMALRMMAACQGGEGRYKEALETLARGDSLAASTSEYPARAASASLRGIVLLHAGKPDQAKVEFIRAVGHMRQSALPERYKRLAEAGHHGNLALVASAKGNLAVARKEAETMRAAMEGWADPQEMFWLHEVLGLVALGERKYDDALAELKQADPKSPYVMYHTGRAYSGKKETEQAMTWYRKAATTYQLPEMQDLLVRRAAQRALGS